MQAFNIRENLNNNFSGSFISSYVGATNQVC